MSSHPEGLKIARARIAEEKENRTGFLDLGMLGLEEWPEELWELGHLEGLNLGRWWTDLAGARRYVVPRFEGNDLPWDQAKWLSFAGLRLLSFGGFGSPSTFNDSYSLACLSALQSLDCSNTQVSSLEPLACLSALRSLDCSYTPVRSLESLARLSVLQSVNCSDTHVSNLEPLASLSALRLLDCHNTQVSSFEPLENLIALETINCSGTQVSSLEPLAGLSVLRSLDCHNTPVGSLGPLANLSALQSLDCRSTPVSSLKPLSSLSALETINCSGTQVSSLEPLSSLSVLETINCSGTLVGDLEPLAKLSALKSLDCHNTQVSSLAPLASLSELKFFNCSGTQVRSLEPLAGLGAMQSLNCSGTQVRSLEPLAGLCALELLNCSYTQVSSLEPLFGLNALQLLDCSGTQVSSLEPLLGLNTLYWLHCFNAPIVNLPETLIRKENLQTLVLRHTALLDIPAEVLSRREYDNCLDSVRAHLYDLKAGGALLPDVKVVVLGNGRIGKTQICNRLRDLPFEANADSTHGIIVTTAPLGDALLRLWDFGGQDLYHGTHALFMRARAVFMLVWTPDSENSATHEHGGVTFRNRPLAWWLAYVRHLARTNCPILVVQNQCDRPEDEQRHSPLDDAALEEFGFNKELHYSALHDRGRPALDDALRQAISWLRENQGQARIGKGRLAVKERIDELRNADALMTDVSQRLHRTITQAHFQALCDECGHVSEPGHLLNYLHHSGVVFYQEGIFDDQIILDQGWALDAVYAVFNRKKCWQQLRQLKGRFTRTLLELLVWQEHSVKEQELLLSMMQSCGICFVHREGDEKRDIETEYLAPDLLPDFEDVAIEVADKWDETASCKEVQVDLPFPHPGVMRGLISRIGRAAGMTAVYWKDGVCVYENTTRSHARIQHQVLGEAGLAGASIRILTQGGRAVELLQLLTKWGREAAQQAGLQEWSCTKDERQLSAALPEKPLAAEEVEVPVLKPEFVPSPPKETTYAVSYAWREKVNGKVNDPLVERFCQRAAERGIRVLRDIDDLGLGEPIAKFMTRVAAQDRMVVILSDKYLRSENCMFELKEVWRYCQENPVTFRERVLVYRLPCARIYDFDYQLEIAMHWLDTFEKSRPMIQRLSGAGVLDAHVLRRFNNLSAFASIASAILHYVADTLRPADFEEFIQHALNLPPEAGGFTV